MRRLVDENGNDRMTRLLRELPEPEPLSDFARARIRARIGGRTGRRWGRLTSLVLLGGAVLAALTLWLHARDPRTTVAASACATTPVPMPDADVRLFGPGRAETLPRRGTVRLASGTMTVLAGTAPLVIELPGARVQVAPGGAVEVQTAPRVVVAAYAGSAVVLWHEIGRPVELRAGQEASSAGVASLPETWREHGDERMRGALEPACVPATMPRLSAGPSAAVNKSAKQPAADAPPALAAPTPAVAPPAALPSLRLAAAPSAVAVAPPHRPRPSPPPAAERAEPAAVEVATPAPRATDEPAPVTVPLLPPPTRLGLGDGNDAAPPLPPPVPMPAAGAASALGDESRLIAEAMALVARDPRNALQRLDERQARFPRGVLRPEAEVLRVDALLRLGREREALAQLDHMAIDDSPRAPELHVTRAELRAAAGRIDEALRELERFGDGVEGVLAERVLYARAACRERRGDPVGARQDLTRYLARFPRGRFTATVERALGR